MKLVLNGVSEVFVQYSKIIAEARPSADTGTWRVLSWSGAGVGLGGWSSHVLVVALSEDVHIVCSWILQVSPVLHLCVQSPLISVLWKRKKILFCLSQVMNRSIFKGIKCMGKIKKCFLEAITRGYCYDLKVRRRGFLSIIEAQTTKGILLEFAKSETLAWKTPQATYAEDHVIKTPRKGSWNVKLVPAGLAQPGRTVLTQHTRGPGLERKGEEEKPHQT